MRLINKLITYTKRIFHKKMYLAMLVFILAISIVYSVLPAKSKTADIKVLICTEDSSDRSKELVSILVNSASVYTFEEAASIDEIKYKVKRGEAECGYFIPSSFFEAYAKGIVEDDDCIKQYISPGTTMSKPINETLFSHILKVSAFDILSYSADMHEYDDELLDHLNYYLDSDEVFTLEDTTSGTFSLSDMVYRVNIPIFEICSIIILFAALLGLLSHLEDEEKGFFLALNKGEVFLNKNVCIFTSIIPVIITSVIAVLISGLGISKLLLILIFGIACHLFTLLLNIIIRKSTLLVRVLPITMFFYAIMVFVLGLF